MHEIMTGEKYVQPKIDEKKAKHEKATLHEVKEEEEEGEDEEKKNAEGKVVNAAERETKGKWSKYYGFYWVLNHILHVISVTACERSRISTAEKPYREHLKAFD